MDCNKCDNFIPSSDFAMFGPTCAACRAPVLTSAEREAKAVAWRAMMERIAAMPDPWAGWETAAPALRRFP